MCNKPEIECTECGWQGMANELWSNLEDENKPVDETRFDTCPDCGCVDCWEDWVDCEEE